MSQLPRVPVLLFGLIVLSHAFCRPTVAAAQAPGAPVRGMQAHAMPNPGMPTNCCTGCKQPPDICTCTSFKPVVDTCYRQQQVVGYRDVCRTCYKQEKYCETVPVTKVDCVTVDEGCYKMVWVPRVVTKQVPRVEYHQQLRCRTVPYAVTQKVPHVTTHVVPEHRVRYVPETHTYIKPPSNPCPTCLPPAAPNCAIPTPLTSHPAAGGFAPQAMASIPQQAIQQPTAVAEYQAPPMSQMRLTPIPRQQQQIGMPPAGLPAVYGQANSVAANTMTANRYLRARAASAPLQANRGFVTP